MPSRSLLPLVATALLLGLCEPARGLVVVGQAQATSSMRAIAIERQGSFLFVAGSEAGLLVLDAADVRAPVQVGVWGSGESVFAVSVSGGLAAAALPDGVVLLDVTDQHEPREISRLLVDGSRYVELIGTRLYVAWQTGSGPEHIQSGLRVFDVTDPEAPTAIGDWSVQEFLGGFTVQAGRVAFSTDQIIVGSYEGRLRILDVSSGDPTPTGRFDAPGSFARPAWAGSHVFVPMRNGGYEGPSGLRVLEVPANGDPVERGVWTTHRDAYRARVRGGLVALALASGGIVLVDVSDPETPALRAELNPPGYWTDFSDAAFDGAYLHVASGNRVVTVSLADLDHPRRLGYAPLPEEPRWGVPRSPYTVVVEGARAYVTTDTRQMHVVDLSDPATPRLRGMVRVPGLVATDAAALGMYAFVTWYGYTGTGQSVGGVQVFDATDPDELDLVSELNGLGRCYRVVREGTMLVVGCDFAVHLVDISEPGSPRLRSSTLLPATLQTLSFAGAHVFAGWQNMFQPYLFGTRVIGVADLDAPTVQPDLSFLARGVAFRDDLVIAGYGVQLGVFSPDLMGDPLETIPVSAGHVRDAGRLVWLGGRAGLQVVDLPSPDRARTLGGVAAGMDFDRLGSLWVSTAFGGVAVFDFGEEFTPSDRDGDGRLDALDACPDLAGEKDRDTDRDGMGDACDPTPVPEPGASGVALALGMLASLRRLRPRSE